MRIIIALLFLSSIIFSFENFNQAKKILSNEVYNNEELMEGFYTGVKYKKVIIDGKIKQVPINYKPLNKLTKKGKVNYRAKRIEWEHIVPAENFGRTLKECRKNGKFIGRKNCKKISPLFRKMEGDPRNLVPAVGEINADRSNYKFSSELAPKNSKYGIYIDKKAKRIHIPVKKRGQVARAYLYMNKKYNMPLSKQEKKLFTSWNNEYPKTNKEILVYKKIETAKKKIANKKTLKTVRKIANKNKLYIPNSQDQLKLKKKKTTKTMKKNPLKKKTKVLSKNKRKIKVVYKKRGKKLLAFMDAKSFKKVSKLKNMKFLKNVKGSAVVMIAFESGVSVYTLLHGGMTYKKVSTLLLNNTRSLASDGFSRGIAFITPPPATLVVITTIAGTMVIEYAIDKYIELEKRNYIGLEDMLWDVPKEIKNKITGLNLEDTKKKTVFDFSSVNKKTVLDDEVDGESVFEETQKEEKNSLDY